MRRSLARSTASSTCAELSPHRSRELDGGAGSPGGSPAPGRWETLARWIEFFSVVEGMSVTFVHAYTNPRSLPRIEQAPASRSAGKEGSRIDRSRRLPEGDNSSCACGDEQVSCRSRHSALPSCLRGYGEAA